MTGRSGMYAASPRTASRGRQIAALAIAVMLAAVGLHDTTADAAETKAVSIGDASVVEGDGGKHRVLRFSVTLSEPSTNEVTVDYTIAGDTATGAARPGPGVDFRDLGGVTRTLSFRVTAKGTTPVRKAVSVVVYPDTQTESDETFTVTLSNPSGGYELGRALGTGTIIDDDPGSGVLAVSVGDGSLVEGDATRRVVQVPVALSSPATEEVLVDVVISGGTATCAKIRYGVIPAGVDCNDLDGRVRTLKFRPGASGFTPVFRLVAVNVYPDLDGEDDETVFVTASNARAADPLSTLPMAITRPVGTVTIVDDDGGPGEFTTESFLIGPFDLAAMGQPGSDSESNGSAPRPVGAVGIKGMRFDVVDQNGDSVPMTDVHLHHVVMLDTSRPDVLCPSLPFNRFAGSGSERTPLILGDDYAYRVGANDSWNALWHVMNMTMQPRTVYIKYEIDHVPASATAAARGVTSYFYDVAGCWGNSEYEVPGDGGPGSVHTKSRTYTAGQSGTRVAVGGHFHNGGIDIALTRTATGDLVCRNEAMYMSGHLHSISACNDPTPVTAGEQFTVTARYENDEPISGAMGIQLSYVWEP